MTKYLYSKRGIFRDTGAVLPPKQHTRCFHPQGHTCRCKILEHKWGSGPAAEQDSQGVRWHGRPGVRARAKAPEPRAAAVTPATGPPDTQGSGLGASACVRAPPRPHQPGRGSRTGCAREEGRQVHRLRAREARSVPRTLASPLAAASHQTCGPVLTWCHCRWGHRRGCRSRGGWTEPPRVPAE